MSINEVQLSISVIEGDAGAVAQCPLLGLVVAAPSKSIAMDNLRYSITAYCRDLQFREDVSHGAKPQLEVAKQVAEHGCQLVELDDWLYSQTCFTGSRSMVKVA